MTTNASWALASVIFVSLLSLVGIAFVSVNEEKLRRIVFVMVSLAVGALFGDAFIHLLPETFEHTKSPIEGSLYVLAGIFMFFVLEKFLRWRHEHVMDSAEQVHPLGYMNLAADAVHNFIDGMIIGGSYLVSPAVGFTTTVAIVFHEIPHELGNFFVLLHARFTVRKALLYNLISAVFAILGSITALLIGSQVAGFSRYIVPFAAGGFIYIAGSDLVPELHKEIRLHKSLIQLLSIGAGIGVMLLLVKLE